MTVLETARLTLRPLRADDFDAYNAIFAKPQVVRYLGGNTETPGITNRAITNWSKAWAEGRYAPWGVVHRASNTLIGHAGLQFLKDFDAPEVLYMFDEPWWGQGIASEAAVASMQYGWQTLKLPKIVGLAFEENGPSKHILEAKCGLTRVGPIDYHGVTLIHFEAARPLN